MNAYLRTSFEELYREDGLCVMGRGVGVKDLYARFVQVYACPRAHKTVFCLGAVDEEKWITDSLRSNGASPDGLPKIIYGDMPVSDRRTMYSHGGCFIATSRIIINDLLKGIVNPTQISGFLVYNAHRITETSIETFILRVFKQDNRTGFVKLCKAFSDDPERLCTGLGKLERLLQHLYVKKLYLWPRFHFQVHSALTSAAQEPDVTELSIPMPTPMTEVQTAILAALDTCMQELKRSTPQVDPTLMTLENGIFHSFEASIRAQLDPEWHRLSLRTKQLVADLKTLRELLDYLVRYDAITFYSYLLTLKSAATTQQTPSLWLTSSVADNLFRCSRERVLKVVPSEDAPSVQVAEDMNSIYLPLVEVPAKWIAVQDVMEEIRQKRNVEKNGDACHTSIAFSRIVVLVRDERALCQLRDFLADPRPHGGGILENKLRLFVTHQATGIRQGMSSGKSRGRNPSNESSAPISDRDFNKLRSDQKMMLVLERALQSNSLMVETSAAGTMFTVKQNHSSEERGVSDTCRKNKKRPRETDGDSSEYNELLGRVLDPSMHVSFLTHADCKSSCNPFDDLSPENIIIVDADIATIRLIETYQLKRGVRVKVYFLMYEDSIEEHRYIAALKREKKSFEDLIDKKAHMVVTLPDDPALCMSVGDDGGLAGDSRSIRSRRVADGAAKPTIVVDMPDYFTGVVICSVLLLRFTTGDNFQVGDYILSPQVCVERKGISDLFQSFASGRLYSQVEQMGRHYELCCLLIEFSTQRSFSLQAVDDIPTDIQMSNICSKISLLTLAFPNLSILWSRSAHATIDIFRSLKSSFEEPDADIAASVGSDGGSGSVVGNESGENDAFASLELQASAQDMLMSLPGINNQNFRTVMNNVNDIAQLSTMTTEQLVPLIGPANAKALVSFFTRKA